MKNRIAIWMGVGALVVVFWRLCIVASHPSPTWIWWILVDLTCPIALARQHALSFWYVLLANAVTYALVGALVEAIRRQSDAADSTMT